MMKNTLDDFFGDVGVCVKCGAECDADHELCATCLNEAMAKEIETVDVRSNSEDEMEDQ